MRLGYVIVYVPDVAVALSFWEQAFGLERRFLHESGTYGELETGATAIGFAAHELGLNNLPGGYVRASDSLKPLGIEIALVTTDVNAAVSKAVEVGATLLKAPVLKPWGQTVAYVRTPDGTLVELCTPVHG